VLSEFRHSERRPLLTIVIIVTIRCLIIHRLLSVVVNFFAVDVSLCSPGLSTPLV